MSGAVLKMVGIVGVVFLVIHFAMMARIQTGHQTDDDLLANRMRSLNTRLRRLERIHREEIAAQDKEDEYVFDSKMAAVEKQLASRTKRNSLNIDAPDHDHDGRDDNDTITTDDNTDTETRRPPIKRIRRRQPSTPIVIATKPSANAGRQQPPSAASPSNGVAAAMPTKKVATKPAAEFDFKVSTCAHEDFGDGLVQRWRDAGKEACTTSQGGFSRMMGYTLTQARHTGPDHTFGMTKVRFQHGTFQLDCQPTSVIKNGQMTAHVYQPNRDIYQFLDQSRYGVTFDAPSSIVWDDTPTLFISRDCPPPFNIFHCSASMINVVTTALLYDLSFADIRVMFLDHEPESFMPIWNALAGKGVFIREKWGAYSDVYLNKAIVAIPAGGSFIWKDGWKASPCTDKSPIMVRYNRLVWHAVLGDDFTLPAVTPHKVVLFSRRTAAYRRAHNEEQLAQAIRDELHIEVIVADMGSKSLHEQIQLVNTATVIIGMHGAAMMHIAHLVDPSRVAVIEMFTDERDRPTMYENFCLWLACRKYQPWIGPGKSNEGVNVDIPTVVKWTRELTSS